MNIHHRLGRLASDRRLVPLSSGPAAALPPVRLRTAADVLALLGQQIDAARNDARAGPVEKARLVGYLAGLGLRAIEVGNLEGRIEMLEAVLKQRQGDGRP
jgi:hypothetical protein